MGVLKIPVTKAKQTIDIDDEKLPDHVFSAALFLGLKELANRGQSKITVAKLEGEELAKAQAAAMEKAIENVAAMYDGTVKLPGTKASPKESRAVMDEAMRQAKAVVKDYIKNELKLKISAVAPSEITRKAKELVASDPSYIEKAKAIVEQRTKPAQVTISFADVHEDPKLAKKVDERKAKAKAPGLSAKQAGKAAPRAKAKAPAQAEA